MKVSAGNLQLAVLVVAVALLVLLLFITVSSALSNSSKIDETINTVNTLHLASEGLTRRVLTQHRELHSLLENPDTDSVTTFLQRNAAILARIEELKATWPDDATLQNAFSAIIRHVKELSDNVIVRDNSTAAQISQYHEDIEDILALVYQLHELALIESREQIYVLRQALVQEAIVSGIILIIGIAVAVLFFLNARRSLFRPLIRLVDATKDVAHGNLTVSLEERGAEEVRDLARSFNRMTEQLREDRAKLLGFRKDLEDTVQRRTRELAESRQNLRDIIAGSPISISIFNPDGILVDCNSAFLELSGFDSTADCAGSFSLGSSPPFESEIFTEAFQQSLNGKPVVCGPLPVQGRNSVLWLMQHLVPLCDKAEQVLSIIVYTVDITTEREAQDHIVKKNRELESFIYSVSHDLKSPLFSVSGLAAMVQDELETGTYTRLPELAERIQVNLKNMEQIINDLLELSRAGANSENFSSFDPAELIKLAFHEEKTRRAEVEAALKLEKLSRLHADRTLFLQVFRNLCSNAFKYRTPGKALRIQVSEQVWENGIRITFADNGEGIDPRFVDKVFEAFYRASENAHGSGVGLAIVKRVIESHGGEISLKSEIGAGTQICIDLPATILALDSQGNQTQN